MRKQLELFVSHQKGIQRGTGSKYSSISKFFTTQGKEEIFFVVIGQLNDIHK
jgi:hypothetical protein